MGEGQCLLVAAQGALGEARILGSFPGQEPLCHQEGGAGRGEVSGPFPASALSGGHALCGGPAAAAPELGSSFMDTTSGSQLPSFPPSQRRLLPLSSHPQGGALL